jgi:hypothetical protein
VAPADSMIQNGMNTGEMQMKLLQKVEELTLYVIEQGKQNEELKQQLQMQQRQIESLKDKNGMKRVEEPENENFNWRRTKSRNV